MADFSPWINAVLTVVLIAEVYILVCIIWKKKIKFKDIPMAVIIFDIVLLGALTFTYSDLISRLAIIGLVIALITYVMDWQKEDKSDRIIERLDRIEKSLKDLTDREQMDCPENIKRMQKDTENSTSNKEVENLPAAEPSEEPPEDDDPADHPPDKEESPDHPGK